MILRHHISTQWQGCGLAATNRLLKIIEVLPFLLDRKCGENNSVTIAVSLLQSLMVYQAHSLHSVSVHAAIISLKRNFWSHYLTVTCFSAHLVIGVANGKKPLLNQTFLLESLLLWLMKHTVFQNGMYTVSFACRNCPFSWLFLYRSHDFRPHYEQITELHASVSRNRKTDSSMYCNI